MADYILNYKLLGKRIKEARDKNNITQAQLAEIINKTPNYVARLETNKCGLSLKTLILIANSLNVSIDFLLSNGESNNKFDKDNLNYIFLEQTLSSLDNKDRDFIINILVNIINNLRIYKGE